MDRYQQADCDWLECMKRIGRKETLYFEQDNVGYSDQIVWFNSRREIMVWVYSVLKQYKVITPIENLDPDVKNQMWAFVKEICAGRLNNKDKMIEVAKTFYVIEYFLSEKQN